MNASAEDGLLLSHLAGARGIRGALVRFILPRDDEGVDELGVPHRVHYWVLAIYAACVALGPIIFSFADYGEELRNPVTRFNCISGLVIAPLFVIVGRRFGYVFKDWVFQSTLLFVGLATFTSNFMTPQMVAPFMTIYILGPLGAAFYLPGRKAMPIVGFGLFAILFMSARVDEPDAMLRGMIFAIVTLVSAQLGYELKRRLIKTVQSNHEVAERDPLTGAHNMHRFEQRLSEEIARAQRGGAGFALVAFDLDNFKQVNETHNHSVGDDVLIAAAEAIRSSLEPTDLLVRRGGDEFSAVIPLTDSRDVAEIVEIARTRIANARREICPALTPYASAGWVTYEHGQTAAELLARADGALHDAKATAPERRGHAPNGPTPLLPRIAADASATDMLDNARTTAATIQDDPIAGVMKLSWLAAARVIIACCVVVVAMVVAGATSFEFSTPETAVITAWVLMFAPVAIWARKYKRQPVWLIHALAVAAFGMISASCLVIGDAAPALTDLFLIAVLLIVALLPFRYAVLYMTAGLTLHGYILFSSGYPLAEIRVSVTAVNMTLAAMVLAITRQHTIAAARQKAALARTDALTGLPNTRRLRDRIDDEIRRCTTTGGRFALLMLDLDDFKSVNDLYSHSLGDKTLVAVADAIRSTARHADMPARRGGDEFAIVMTDAGENEATLAARRVERSISTSRERVVPGINPGASVGWVVWRRGDTADELIDRADDALHAVKAEARRDPAHYASAGHRA